MQRRALSQDNFDVKKMNASRSNAIRAWVDWLVLGSSTFGDICKEACRKLPRFLAERW